MKENQFEIIINSILLISSQIGALFELQTGRMDEVSKCIKKNNELAESLTLALGKYKSSDGQV